MLKMSVACHFEAPYYHHQRATSQNKRSTACFQFGLGAILTHEHLAAWGAAGRQQIAL